MSDNRDESKEDINMILSGFPRWFRSRFMSGSYYWLSRQGMAAGDQCGLAGVLYVPFEYAKARKDLTLHHVLKVLYAPLNLIDQYVFGGHAPVDCIMWRLSG